MQRREKPAAGSARGERGPPGAHTHPPRWPRPLGWPPLGPGVPQTCNPPMAHKRARERERGRHEGVLDGKKKESSFRGNVLWSVKLQPVVLHIVPEALQKLILQRDQRCLDGERGRGAHRHGGRGREGGFYSFCALFLINCSFKTQLGVDLLTRPPRAASGLLQSVAGGAAGPCPAPPFSPIPSRPPPGCARRHRAPQPAAPGAGPGAQPGRVQQSALLAAPWP